MRSIRIIDRPIYKPRVLYDEAVNRVISMNENLPGLRSIYRFGNITAPGISDLDLLFVFENGSRCNLNGLEKLPEQYNSLFTHGIMALSERHYYENLHFTLWSEHELLWGKTNEEFIHQRNSTEEKELKIQTAIEFLVANYLDIKIQKAYGVIKLRALLQHMKGIAYDLEYLEEKDPVLMPHIQKLRNWILHWFDKTPSDNEILSWLDTFENEYDKYCAKKLREYPMYLPQMEQYRISKNMLLEASGTMNLERRGILLPSFLSVAGRKFVKMQHRLNTFIFHCPLNHQASEIVKQRFGFLKEMKSYNREHLPNFMTMTTSITAKLI